ncbi:hypothetical protein FGO68_gene9497 [Halteria grandinella]|uniref:Uncharacterized protein n=1 Tax=Halteria grandinella TaxID=5974 RepID=A0A8J8T0V7_HALGN|nr:hypothetical protein FGO68_gene9497 [Halteria grandinella]
MSSASTANTESYDSCLSKEEDFGSLHATPAASRLTQKPSLVVHKRTGKHLYIQYRISQRSKATRKFLLIKEAQLPTLFGQALKNQFKAHETSRSYHADQDVDTDEDNVLYGQTQLLASLKQAISGFSKSHKKPMDTVNNIKYSQQMQRYDLKFE